MPFTKESQQSQMVLIDFAVVFVQQLVLQKSFASFFMFVQLVHIACPHLSTIFSPCAIKCPCIAFRLLTLPMCQCFLEMTIDRPLPTLSFHQPPFNLGVCLSTSPCPSLFHPQPFTTMILFVHPFAATPCANKLHSCVGTISSLKALEH